MTSLIILQHFRASFINGKLSKCHRNYDRFDLIRAEKYFLIDHSCLSDNIEPLLNFKTIRRMILSQVDWDQWERRR